jgi:hypothetical protein
MSQIVIETRPARPERAAEGTMRKLLCLLALLAVVLALVLSQLFGGKGASAKTIEEQKDVPTSAAADRDPARSQRSRDEVERFIHESAQQ